MNSILEICQEVADICATQRPTNLFNKSNQNDSIFLSVAKVELDSLMRYGDWQDLTKEAVIYTVKNKTVYPIDNIVSDFYSILNNTIYIKDESDKVIGAITPEDWMKDRYFQADNGRIKFKIQNNCIKFVNAPEPNLHIVFMYRSNAVCTDAETYEDKATITKNTDKPIFDNYVVKLGITWRWLKRNGLDYTEEFNEYQKELKKKFGTSLATQDINLGGRVFDIDEYGAINVIKECE
ncbi:MAG: hypothetical protein KBT03_13775 [Bacteroidales bacterium]|nr:hypothetical protein [Candidatus Scybalousia scybalohippi]